MLSQYVCAIFLYWPLETTTTSDTSTFLTTIKYSQNGLFLDFPTFLCMRIAWWSTFNIIFLNKRSSFCFLDNFLFLNSFHFLFFYEHSKFSRNNCFPFLYPGGGNSSITALLVPHLHLKKADSLGGNIFHSQYDHPVSRKSPERMKYCQLL